MMRNLAARTIDAGGKLTVRSALNPMLWFCAVVSFPFLVVLAILINNPRIPQWLLIGLFILIAVPIGCTIFSAIFLLLFDRDKLQSEDYQIRKKSLELIQVKGGPISYLPDSINAVPKPLPNRFRLTKKIKKEAKK